MYFTIASSYATAMTSKDFRRERLRRLINEMGKSLGIERGKQKLFADRVETPAAYISQIINGTRELGDDVARRIEEKLGLRPGEMDLPLHDEDHLNTGNVVPVSSTVRNVPLISWVQAGHWNEAVDMHEPGYAEDWEPTTERVGPNAFALRVQGDSMEPEFPAGGIVIVDPSVEARNGDYVIAKVGGSATFKQYVEDAGRAYLKPLNARYQIIEMTEGCSIAGVVVSQNKRYR